MVAMVVQRGQGAQRPLVVGYFVAQPALATLLGVLGPASCVVVDNDDTGGRFARQAGSGGVDGLPAVLARATAAGDKFTPSSVVLVGWSAGCQAVREQLRASVGKVDAALAWDGVAGSLPVTDAQLSPWVDLAKRAAAGGPGSPLLVVTHTQQTYVEQLPEGKRFASTVRTATLLCAAAGLEAPGPGEEVSKGGLHVVSTASRSIDGPAHMQQARLVGPDAARRFLVPWLAARAPALAPGAPSPSPPPAVGA